MRAEAQLQKACVAWVREQGYLVVGGWTGVLFKRGVRTWKWLRGQGVEAGVPDLLVLARGVNGAAGLAVELKTGRNNLTARQAAWFERARQCGWTCVVVRTKEEFVAAVNSHVNGGTPSPSSPSCSAVAQYGLTSDRRSVALQTMHASTASTAFIDRPGLPRGANGGGAMAQCAYVDLTTDDDEQGPRVGKGRLVVDLAE